MQRAKLKMSYKTVFIDFDGVIRHWLVSDVHEGETRLGLKEGTLHKTAFHPDFLLPVITGKQSHSQWMKDVCREIAAETNEVSVENLLKIWEGARWTIDYSLLSEIRNLFVNSKIALASNATDRLNNDLESSSLSGAFDFLLNSSEIGFAKPDSRFFEKALEICNCKPDQTLFIDDQQANVIAARKLGIQSILFTGKEELLSRLKSLG